MEQSVTETPTVSVVIPYYNDADTIERAVQSVLAQAFTDFELLIVDDGSEEELIGGIGDSAAHRVRIIRHETNRGAAAARNTGITQSKGHYVAFLDADDCWRPNKLAQQLGALRNAEEKIVACVCGFALHREGVDKTEVHTTGPMRPFMNELIWGCRVSPGSTLLCARNCFDTVGLFDEDLRRLEDWDWLLSFAKQNEVGYIPTILADIFVTKAGGGARCTAVREATRIIKNKHLKTISQLGLIMRQQFLSTLAIENAAAWYRNGDKIRAGIFAIWSLTIWPFRNARFFRRLSRCMFH